MRTRRPRLVHLTLLLGGCQLLPQSEIPCAQSTSCAPSVQMPFILGQPDEKTNWIQGGLSRASGVLMVGGRLVVSDYGNNRVLIWSPFPSRNNQPPDLVLGEPDFGELTYGGPQAQQINNPTRMTSDGTMLIVASDASGPYYPKPLLFWNTFPTTNYQAFDFAFNNAPGMPSLSARTFIGGSPLLVGGHLYVGDRGFNRMLYFSTPPTTPTDATAALGQGSPVSGQMPNPGGVSGATLNGPEGTPASDGTTLFVPDTQNHRVLGFGMLPTTNGATATFALGQPNAGSNTPNNNGPTFSTLNLPAGVAVGGTKLLVADRGNHRVLIWNSLPSTSGQAASLVLGQPNASSVSSNYNGVSAASLNSPTAVASDGVAVAVADTGNNRILLWKSFPTVTQQPADLVLGQPSMNNRGNNGEFGTAQRFMAPHSITHAGSRFIVSDFDGNRVLIWSQFPTGAQAMPALVLGQPDFTTTTANPMGVAASSMSSPAGVSSDGTVLAVADYYNNRVLLWNSIPTQNRQPADVALGQAGLTTADQNNGGAAHGMAQPLGVCVAGGRLYVADTYNNRVLIWKSIPGQGQQPDIVLGQTDLGGTMYNHGGSTLDGSGLSQPGGVYADGQHIFVSDTQNNRVLIWNTLDVSSGQPADVVLGASDLGTYGQLSNPTGILVEKGRLYVSEPGASRVSIWQSIPTQNNIPAGNVLGQSSLSGNRPNNNGISVTSLQRPNGLLVTDAGIYIADTGNGRVTARPLLP